MTRVLPLRCFLYVYSQHQSSHFGQLYATKLHQECKTEKIEDEFKRLKLGTPGDFVISINCFTKRPCGYKCDEKKHHFCSIFQT